MLDNAHTAAIPNVDAKGEMRLRFHGQVRLDSPWPNRIYSPCCGGSPHSSGSFWRRTFSNKAFPPTLWVPILIALISFWYANIDAGRRERLEFVRSQIANLYGPLYSLIRTQKHLWEDLGKNSR